MHIAVTGSAGRFGRVVVPFLESRGHTVRAIDRAAVPSTGSGTGRATVVDLNDPAAVLAAFVGCDAVIHLAAHASPLVASATDVHNNNVVTSYNALWACAELGIERVCQMSSVNAIGCAYSRWPRYDFFPLDETHPTYNEDPYSLSKWIIEQQGDTFARRYERMRIASFRLHGLVDRKADMFRAHTVDEAAKHLWGFVNVNEAARACLLALEADFTGHEVFYIVGPTTIVDVPSAELHAKYFPGTALRRALVGRESFYDCGKAARVLGWRHAPDTP